MARKAILALLILTSLDAAAEAQEPKPIDLTDAVAAAEAAAGLDTYDGRLSAAEAWFRAGCVHRARAALEGALAMKPGAAVARSWLSWLKGDPRAVALGPASGMSAKEAHLAGILAGLYGDAEAEQAYLKRALALDPRDPRIQWDQAVAVVRQTGEAASGGSAQPMAAANLERLLRAGSLAEAADLLKAQGWDRPMRSPHLETLRRLAHPGAKNPPPPAAVARFIRSPRFKVATFIFGLSGVKASEGQTKAQARAQRLRDYYDELDTRARELTEAHAGTLYAPSVLLACAATFCEFSGAGRNRMGDAARRAMSDYLAVVAMTPNLPELGGEVRYLSRLYEALEGPAAFESFAAAWRRRCVSPDLGARIDLERLRVIRRSGDSRRCRALLPVVEALVDRGFAFHAAIEQEVRFAHLELDGVPLPVFGAMTTRGAYESKPGRRWTLLEVGQPGCSWCEEGAKLLRRSALDEARVDVLSLQMRASARQKADWERATGWAVLSDPKIEQAILERTGFSATPAYCLLDEKGAIVMIGQGMQWVEAILARLGQLSRREPGR